LSPIRSKKFYKKTTFSSSKRIPKLNDCQILSIEDSTVFNSAARSDKSFVSHNENYFIPQQVRNKKKQTKSQCFGNSNTRGNRFLNSSKTSIDDQVQQNFSLIPNGRKQANENKNNSVGKSLPIFLIKRFKIFFENQTEKRPLINGNS